MTCFIVSTESVDTSANLLAEALDAQFTKDPTQKFPSGAQLIFYGVVKTPEGFKFDTNRMFHTPTGTAKLLKRQDVLNTLKLNKFDVMGYARIKKDTTYTQLRNVLGSKFDVVIKTGLQVVDTVSNASEFDKIKNQVQYACRHLSGKTKRYRLFLGVPDVNAVIGASYSEYKNLSFKEALKFGGDESTSDYIDNLFLKGLLAEQMSPQAFRGWTEEKTVGTMDLVTDKYYSQFEKLAEVIQKNYKTDFCAVDVVMHGDKMVITNITGSPSLQSDKVLELTSEYFKRLMEEGRQFTAADLVKIAESLSPTEINNLGKLLKRAISK